MAATESQRDIEVQVKTEWNLEKAVSSRSSLTNLSEPSPVKTKSEYGNDDSDEANNAHATQKVVTAQDWTGPDDPEVSIPRKYICRTILIFL
jgi:hypothetical protein